MVDRVGDGLSIHTSFAIPDPTPHPFRLLPRMHTAIQNPMVLLLCFGTAS